MNIKRNLLLGLLSLLLSLAGLASNSGPTGCVVQVKKKKKMDPQCECLKSKACYGGEKIKDDGSFFKPINGRDWISSEEKKLLQESHKVHNDIVDIRAKGLVRSREARKLYIKLNEINKKLEKIQKKDHERFVKKIEDRKKRLGIKPPKKNKSYFSKLKSFLSTPFEKLTPSPVKIKNSVPRVQVTQDELQNTPQDNTAISSATEPIRPADKTTPVLSDSFAEELDQDISQLDRDIILEAIAWDDQNNPKKYLPRDKDSLFERISKAYMRSGYVRLLSSAKKE